MFTHFSRMSEPRDIKAHAHRLIDDLPADASWEDVLYAVHVCQLIEAGLADVAAGRTISHEEAIARAHKALEELKPGEHQEEVAAAMAAIQRATAHLHIKRKRKTI